MKKRKSAFRNWGGGCRREINSMYFFFSSERRIGESYCFAVTMTTARAFQHKHKQDCKEAHVPFILSSAFRGFLIAHQANFYSLIHDIACMQVLLSVQSALSFAEKKKLTLRSLFFSLSLLLIFSVTEANTHQKKKRTHISI